MPTRSIPKGKGSQEATRLTRTVDSNFVTSEPASSRSLRIERWLLRRLLNAIGSPQIGVKLWDGQTIESEATPGSPVIRLQDRGTLWKLLMRPDFEFGEAYVSGRLKTDADLVELTRSVFAACHDSSSRPWLEKLVAWAQWPARSLRGSRRNVHHHYDLGNDFYRLWLDRQLLYTCAYFESENLSLEQAQIAKMDHICRKVQLRPGDCVIEAGCGWGAFALHMARNYGARVTAYNISTEQIAYARQEASRVGLADRVTFVEDDWRQVSGRCDVFVSVGMLEHVGPEHYEQLGGIINQSLYPGGRGLIHSIGLDRQRPIDSWTRHRIFPGAQPPTLRQSMQIFEPNELSVLDVENLRLHYARTLRHWLRRFEQQADRVRETFDEEFVRMWRLYLAASVSAFDTGWLQLYQILFAPSSNNTMPMTRHHLYEQHADPVLELDEGAVLI